MVHCSQRCHPTIELYTRLLLALSATTFVYRCLAAGNNYVTQTAVADPGALERREPLKGAWGLIAHFE